MSDKVKHTPGPWAADWTHRTGLGPKEGWFILAGNMKQDPADCIATLEATKNLFHGSDEANANLMAAAPELLSLLKEAYPFVRNTYRADDIGPKSLCERMKVKIQEAESAQ